MRGQYRNMTVISEPFGVGGFKNRSGIALVAGDGNDDIDIQFFDKLVDGLEEFLFNKEMEFWIKTAEHGLQFLFFQFQFRGKGFPI